MKRAQAPLRQLTLAEVEIDISLEPEDIPVEGNLIASGDDEADAADNAAVLERLEQGDESAWCCMVVTASWTSAAGDEYCGRATLGCCNFAPGSGRETAKQSEELAALYGMQEEALAELNERLADVVNSAANLGTELRSGLKSELGAKRRNARRRVKSC